MKVKLEDDGEDNSELIEEIEDSFIEEYIPLPGQYEINEYRIMEEFIYDLPEGRNQDTLERAIQGRGDFRRFKDRLFDLNLEQKWYDYRDRAYERIAKEWCEKYNIDCCDIIHKGSIRFRADKKSSSELTGTALNVILSNCTRPRTG
uniref:UPF0158 family protein n=1 Tax=Coprococcus sp. AF21-14LB TaxID=2292231 RepID=UPI000E4679D7